MRGLIIGRFQPFHFGHQAAIQEIANEVDELIIVVGSAQASHTLENPFTAGERLTMICGALDDLRDRCHIIPLADVDRNAIWVSHLLSMTPAFERVYSNNPLVIQLFKEAGIEVRKPPMYNRDIYSGTAIRRLMLEGRDWRHLTPKSVSSVIDQVNGVERLRNVSGDDLH
jgi:nicotinamide-nucleotide adenylyltransferase